MRVISWLLVIVTCIGVAAGLGYFKYQQIQAAIAFGESFPEPVQAVEPWVARVDEWQPSARVTGELVAPRSVDLLVELPGRVVQVDYEPGAAVEGDQILVRLDTREEQAMLAAARANAELARVELSRAERLVQRKVGTEDVRDSARAQHDAARAEMQRLATIIDRKTLRAPFAALTSLNRIEPGQYLRAGELVTRLTGVDVELWVDFSLPQADANLEVGAVVRLSRAEDPTPIDATVIARETQVNTRSRNVGFRATLDNDGSLFPGMLVRIEVPVGTTQSAVVVPAAAVRRDAFGARVYVLEPAEPGADGPERARERRVVAGRQNGEMLVIVSGLQAGERIAANGAFKLRDGALARALDPSTATAAAGGQ